MEFDLHILSQDITPKYWELYSKHIYNLQLERIFQKCHRLRDVYSDVALKNLKHSNVKIQNLNFTCIANMSL